MTAGQLQAALWLRWRLSRNQWRRRGGLEQALGAVVLVLLAGVVAGCGVGGLAAGYFGLAQASPDVTLLVWDSLLGGFLVFWLLGVMAELQRSETLDLTRLLHLPISPRGLFVINFAASHFTFSVIAAVPALTGLVLGLAAGRGLPDLLLLPLGLGVLFMLTAWMYCLRGWLAALMVNPRRRRSIVVGITAGFVLLMQAPNLVVMATRDRHRPPPPTVVPGAPASPVGTPAAPPASGPHWPPAGWLLAHRLVPLLWLPAGARALAARDPWPALLGTAGALLLGGAGLWRAYRSTLRFYRGETRSNAAPARPRPDPVPRARPFRTWRIPGLSEGVYGVASATLSNLLRAPEVRMALASTLAMTAAFGFLVFMDRPSGPPGRVHGLLALGSVAVAQLALSQLFFNQFGLDRDGFRAFVLAPIRRADILFGKNLAMSLLAAGCGLVPLALLRFMIPVSPATLLAAVCQLGSVAVLLSLAGNVASIFAPYRMATGSLKKAKTPLRTTLLIILIHLSLPLLLLPAAIPAVIDLLLTLTGHVPPVSINLLLSFLLMIAVAGAYWLVLPGLTRCLEQRERRILEAVTQGAE